MNKQDLINFFISNKKTKKKYGIGTEHEKFLFISKNKKRLPFEGPVSIQSLFIHLQKKGWIASNKSYGHLISLTRDGASITLEPGGQVELSGKIQKTIHQTCSEVHNHLDELKEFVKKNKLCMLGLGFDPISKLNDIVWVPKKRYEIMKAYMPKVGNRGLDMMARTCTVQANFDYSSEADLIKKFVVSNRIQSFVSAMFCNSPFREKKYNKYLSNRILTWSDTDPSRCGIQNFFLSKDFSVEEYVDYVLGVQSYFININNKIIDTTKFTFDQILKKQTNIKKIDNHNLSIDDWLTHLSTIFTEVRLKSYIELRGADAGKWDMICALPAFWAGILYDQENLDKLWKETNEWSHKDILMLFKDTAKEGINSKFNGKPIYKYCKYLLDLSTNGLMKRNNLNKKNKSEIIHLTKLKRIVRQRMTPAETLLKETQNGKRVIDVFNKSYY